MAEREYSEMHLRIGDIGFAVASGDPSLVLEAQGAARRFVSAAGAPDVRLIAAWANSHAPEPGELLFDAGSIWKVYRQGDGYQIHFHAPQFGPRPYRTALFNADFTSGELLLNRACFPAGEPLYPLEYPLDELLTINLLSRGRGVEVHACGVLDSDGRGYLFLGMSGAGKSTMGRLWTGESQAASTKVGQAADPVGQVAGAMSQAASPVGQVVNLRRVANPLPAPSAKPQILSDDRIILRRLNGQLWMYGTPWHGEAELAAALRAPVTRIFLLARGPKNEAIPLREPEAVARLMACSFTPFFHSQGIEFTLAFLQEIAEAVPCVELRFVPDERAVEFVRSRIFND
jgi:hypothetical protein